MANPQCIELEEPVVDITGSVEVVLRPVFRSAKPANEDQVASGTQSAQQDIFDFVASLPPGTRTKEDVDRLCYSSGTEQLFPKEFER